MITQGKKRNVSESLQNLSELMEYAEKNCDFIVHTGDLIDYISKPCVEFAKEFLMRKNLLFIAGNHEYAKYDGKKEDMAYRLNSMEEIGGYPVNVFFNSRIVGGVNFVGIDDAYHQVEYEQLEMLNEEAKKGYPIILFMHAPLYEKELYHKSYEFWNGEICLLASDVDAHPSAKGNEIIANIILDKLKELELGCDVSPVIAEKGVDIEIPEIFTKSLRFAGNLFHAISVIYSFFAGIFLIN